jgi:hypothetical protein
MRKFLGILVVIIAVVTLAAAVCWTVWGEGVVSLADRYRTVDATSTPVRYVRYIGDGTGGTLWLDIGDKALVLFNLTPVDPAMAGPHVGTTAKNELAISFAGKVFVCGAIPTDSPLAMNIPGADHATLTSKRSLISWPTWFDSANSKKAKAQWKRNWYYEFSWKHASGAALQMRWQGQQERENGTWAIPSTDTARFVAIEIEIR